MEDLPLPEVIDLGETYAFIDDNVIMLKAVATGGDPVEMTEDEARRLAHWLLSWAERLDVPWCGQGEVLS
jgi:hypothetical protein